MILRPLLLLLALLAPLAGVCAQPFVKHFSFEPGHALALPAEGAELELSFSQRWLLEEIARRHPSVKALYFRRTRDVLGLNNTEKHGTVGLELASETLAELEAAGAWFESWNARSRGRQFLAEVRFLVHDGQFEEGASPRVTALGPDRVKALTEDEKNRVLSAPNVLTMDGQRAQITVAKQTAYVADYEVQRTAAGAIADPIVDVVQEGLNLELCALGAGDGRILLAAEVEIASLRRPIPTEKVRLRGLPGAGEVTVQLPEVETIRWGSEELVLKKGEAGLLVEGLRFPDQKEAGRTRLVKMLIAVRALGEGADRPASAGSVVSIDRGSARCVVHWSDSKQAVKRGERIRWIAATSDGTPQEMVLEAVSGVLDQQQVFRVVAGVPSEWLAVPGREKR